MEYRKCECGTSLVGAHYNRVRCLDCSEKHRANRLRNAHRKVSASILVSDALECPVCHMRFNRLQRQHWLTHGFESAIQFQEAFNLPYLTAPSLRKNLSRMKIGIPYSQERLIAYQQKDFRGKGKGVNGKWIRTREYRERMSKAAIDRMQTKPDFFHHSRHERGWVRSVKADQDVYVRSSWERRVLWVLDQLDEVEEVAVEPFAIPYLFDGTQCHYIPDLLITFQGGVQELWEIKPDKLKKYPKIQAKTAALHAYATAHNMNSGVISLAQIESMERKTRMSMSREAIMGCLGLLPPSTA